jgi:hypothetical protein
MTAYRGEHQPSLSAAGGTRPAYRGEVPVEPSSAVPAQGVVGLLQRLFGFSVLPVKYRQATERAALKPTGSAAESPTRSKRTRPRAPTKTTTSSD